MVQAHVYTYVYLSLLHVFLFLYHGETENLKIFFQILINLFQIICHLRVKNCWYVFKEWGFS